MYALVRTVALDGGGSGSAACRSLPLNMARRRAAARAEEEPLPPPKRGPETVGSRLRAERERQRISLRELARRLDLSASLISQVELGRATPSVGTLYASVSELGISLDEVFDRAPIDGDGFGGGRM